MHSVGLGNQCVAISVWGIVELAQAWAQQPENLNQVRRKLQTAYWEQTRIASPEVPVKGTVYAMRQMWRYWCKGEKPKSFGINFDDIDRIV